MPQRDIPFHEWKQERDRLAKAPTAGGIRAPLNPGVGMFGPPGNTPSYAPTGPRDRRSGLQGSPSPNSPLPGPSDQSKYTYERPSQPDPWIDDVDMGSSWFSPFQPIWPYGPPWQTRPREFDFPVGYNLNYVQPRMELMGMLRGMRDSWGVLATIIATRQDQLLRIPWTIQRKDKPRAGGAAVDEMRKFFRRPDGKLSYSQWSRKLTDDLLVIDAPSIYFSRDRKGRPLTAEVIDGATIFPLIDDAGRRPDSIVELDDDGIEYLRRQPAFQQIIKGLPMLDLDESELMYVPMRPRPNMPMFGYPPTEQIYIETSEAILKTIYQRNFWGEGNIPDLIVNVPKEWSPRQIAMFQGHFDAMLSGNLNLKSKVRFLPGDMKPFDVKNSSGESLWSQRDEMLIRLACYSYSVSPTPFVKQTNRSVAQNAQQTAEEEGLYPLMAFWKDDIIDPIIQERFGYEDIEFIFLPRPEPDADKQAKIHDMQIKNGERTRNECRNELGWEPIEGGDVATIEIGNAVIPVKDAAQGQAMPMGTMGSPNPNPKHSPTDSTPRKPLENNPLRGPASSSTSAQPARKLGKLTQDEVTSAADGATEDLDTLSREQIHSGNYPKGHLWFHGLNISIENNRGSKRGEKTEGGKKKWVRMPAPYGYIRGTIGADKSQVDCYLGQDPASTTVWVVDQNKVSKKGKVKGFDEHKVFLGYTKLKHVLRDYLDSHFDGLGHERLENVVELSLKDFKNWLSSGDTRKPIEGQAGTTVLKGKDLRKSLDTISSATGLSWYDQRVGQMAPKRKKKKSKRRSSPGPRWLELTATLH